MSEPFLAEIRIIGFNFAPRGWAFCDGQILPISQNQSLYSLLGTTYGGDGRTNFALPDLRGRVPVHPDNQIQLGQHGGEETHTLSVTELPEHNHQFIASNSTGSATVPANNLLAISSDLPYQPPNTPVTMANMVQNTGGGQSHNNMQPYLVLNFCIALQGLFPPHN
ncbi:MAG: tail fiber protein [Phototrophicales bacterium]